jgi:Cu-Zn family superoxide dismutase
VKSFRLIAMTVACAWSVAAVAQDKPLTQTVQLKTGAGASAGSAELVEAPNGVLIRLEAKGLPAGWHGLHFHEKGDCSKADFTSAGGHVHDKATMVHGLLNPDANEAGDLPNVFAGSDGSVTAEIFSPYVSLEGAGGRPALSDTDGAALVIHANRDDHRAQPIGGAGARIACGSIPAKAG